MGHVGLQVLDISSSAAYAVEVLGLRETARQSDRVLFSASERHHELQLLSSNRAGLDHVGFEVDTTSELREIHERVERGGVPILSDSPEEEGIAEAFRVQGPGNLVLEFYAGMRTEPMSVQAALRRPLRRFGHVTIVSPESKRMVAFLVETLGFRVSDRLNDLLTWVRCDTVHHCIAVASGSTTRLHHYAFELADWGAMRDALDNLAMTGGRAIWGPVRHGPGFSLSSYLRDPAGALVEIYTDLLRIESDATYIAVDWSKVSGPRNLWGPDPDPSFLEYGIPILSPAVARG